MVNPGGSVKDRVAIAMIDAAEASGALQPGGTIVEPTSGNTGAGLAIVAAQRGYHCIFVMSDKMSDEKIALLRSYGAEVVVCPTAVPPEDPRSYYSTAERLVRETPGAFRPDQYSNPANPLAHERTTGPEIWRQTDGKVTHFVAGIGTGGTITGVARYLKAQNPAVQIVGADPSGSVYSGGTGRPYLVEGVGEDFWPTTFDPSLVDRVIEVSDADSFLTARRVTQQEGLLIGGSCGTAVHAALEVARDLGPGDIVVVLLPDSGRSYLSKIFDDEWMFDMGFLRAEGTVVGDVLAAKGGDLPDLVLIEPDESARTAITLMHDTGVSQLVVSVTKELPLAAKEVVGTVRELELMDRVYRDGGSARPPGRRHLRRRDADDRIRRAGRARRRAARPRALGARARRRSPDRRPRRAPTCSRSSPHARYRHSRRGATLSHDLGFETRAIHAGQEPDPTTGAVVPPISLATTFAQDAVGKHRGYEYAAQRQPDAQRARDVPRVARRRGSRPRVRERPGRRGRVPPHASPGDHVILPTDAYGGTFRLVARVHERFGIEWSAVDLGDLDAVADAWTDATRMVWVETPTNPALNIVDIAAVARARARPRRASRRRQHLRDAVPPAAARARRRRGRALAAPSISAVTPTSSAVSSRRTTPSSKTSCGSSRTRWARSRRRSTAISCSAVCRRWVSAWTGTARTRAAIVDVLRAHDAVARTFYPGLPDHPGHDIAARQMRDFGGMVSFTLVGGENSRARRGRQDAAVHPRRVARRGRVVDRASRRA